MKKLISSLLAATTLLSVASLSSFAEEEAKGTSVQVDALYFETAPTIDGTITAEEWGEKTFTVSGATAAVRGDTAPNSENTYAWWGQSVDDEGVTTDDEAARDKVKATSYDVWLRWDTEFFYVGVVVNDPDGYYLPNGRENIWDGDCLQLRVDPQGPNSYLSYKNPDYNYVTDPFIPEDASAINFMPWVYRTKICNIGFGLIDGKPQAYDMADDGCGNFERKMQVNDEKKLGAGSSNSNAYADGKTMATLFQMTNTPAEGGATTNTYEIAMPWAYLDQWHLGQVAVDYVWGMSLVRLLANEEDGFYSYLTWGSGICGSQQKNKDERATCGGSQAVRLSDVSALSGEAVEGLPQKTDKEVVEGEVQENVLNLLGIGSYYLGSTEYTFTGGYSASADIAFIGTHPTDEEKTLIGFRLGENYGYEAGYDPYEKKFFIAEEAFDSGIVKTNPYAKTDAEYEWAVGEWHNLGVMVSGTTVSVVFDGEVVLTDTDPKYNCTAGNDYQIILYNLGDYYVDNLLYADAGYDLVTGENADKVRALFTFNSDDDAFNVSDINLNLLPWQMVVEEAECKNANEDSDYGCNFVEDVVDGKRVSICHYCGESHALCTPGDVNGDEKINISDALAIMKYAAQYDIEIDLDAADVNADGKVNISDAVKIMKYVAGYEGIVLGEA